MPNRETIVIRMTRVEADSLAYVLMTALARISMLERERRDATAIAVEVFKQLEYGHTTDSHGQRVEETEVEGKHAK